MPSLRVGSLSNNCMSREDKHNQRGQLSSERQVYFIFGEGYSTNLLHQVLGLLGDPAGEVGCVHPDGLKQLILIITMER